MHVRYYVSLVSQILQGAYRLEIVSARSYRLEIISARSERVWSTTYTFFVLRNRRILSIAD